jgi:hypothetical protein
MRAATAACAAMMIVAPAMAMAAAQAEPAASPYDGRLTRALFLSEDVAADLAAVAASAPAAAREMLSSAAERARRAGAAASTAGPASLSRELTQAMAALAATPAARAEIAALVDQLVAPNPSPVTSAMGAEVPLWRAEVAEKYLKAHPDSELVPFLYLYLMVQNRLAFEAQTAAKALDGQKATAKKYRAFRLRGRAVDDPLVKAVAEDLDGMIFLRRPIAEHPRDFDPDACCRNR